MAEPPPYPGAPRWVKVSGIIAGVLLLLVIIVAVAGGGRHGPGRHMPWNATGDAPAGSVSPDDGQR